MTNEPTKAPKADTSDLLEVTEATQIDLSEIEVRENNICICTTSFW
jgi:hypothetical protein